jgi:hypothetical protein
MSLLKKNDDGSYTLDEKEWKEESKSLGYNAAICTTHDCLDSMRARDSVRQDLEMVGKEPHRESFIAGVTEGFEEVKGYGETFEIILDRATRYEGV